MKRWLALFAFLILAPSAARAQFVPAPAQAGVLCTPTVYCTPTGPNNTNTGDPTYVFAGKANDNFYSLFTMFGVNSSFANTGVLSSSDILSVLGGVPPSDLTPIPAGAFLVNPTSSNAAPQAVNPLYAANLMSAPITVAYAAVANVATLSGIQSITVQTNSHSGGTTVTPASNALVLLTAQTTTSQNGLWIANQAGIWYRPVNFPSGAVIAVNCVVVVIDQNTGSRWALVTLTGVGGAGTPTAVTIDSLTTGAQVWQQEESSATTTQLGGVKITSAGHPFDPVPSMVGAPTAWTLGTGYGIWPCASAGDTAGSLQWSGDPSADLLYGACVLFDGATGHWDRYPNALNSSGQTLQPTASCTGSGCAAGTPESDGFHTDTGGTFTAVTVPAAGTWTITYAASYGWLPSCFISVHAPLTEQPYISAQPATSGRYTAVTWTFPVAITTQTVNWGCL